MQGFTDELAWGAAWLYAATNQSSYLQDAKVGCKSLSLLHLSQYAMLQSSGCLHSLSLAMLLQRYYGECCNQGGYTFEVSYLLTMHCLPCNCM